MRTFMLTLALGCLACGPNRRAPSPNLSPAEALKQCRATQDQILERLQVLGAERAEVEANMNALPPGYDRTSIKATLAHIDKESEMRMISLPAMRARCDRLQVKLDDARYAIPK